MTYGFTFDHLDFVDDFKAWQLESKDAKRLNEAYGASGFASGDVLAFKDGSGNIASFRVISVVTSRKNVMLDLARITQ